MSVTTREQADWLHETKCDAICASTSVRFGLERGRDDHVAIGRIWLESKLSCPRELHDILVLIHSGCIAQEIQQLGKGAA